MVWGRAVAPVREQIGLIAPKSCSVLIRGESGTGKELVAREIHENSARADRPFVAVDCTTLSEGIFESQLFGHVRGAFTSADRATVGFARTAHGGTLFLDEIGDLPLPVQAKLLRMLQERVVVPVGATEEIPIDVRVIAATHQDLPAMVASGEFRKDLYYRLAVVSLAIPPLRERGGDLRLLLESFLERFADPAKGPIGLSEEVWAALEGYQWPGNVRELLNAAESISVLCPGPVVELDDLPGHILGGETALRQEDHPTADDTDLLVRSLDLETTTRATLMLAVRLTRGNQSQAAKLLGIDRKTLSRKLSKLGIDVEELTASGS